MNEKMNETERLELIVEFLAKRRFATVKDLLKILDASPATIRRDIAKLHETGQVRKVFGGITLAEEVTSEQISAKPFEVNRVLHIDRKEAIAIEAEKMCSDGDSIIIHGGTSCFLFAQRLVKRSLRIFPNAMPMAANLFEHDVCQLVASRDELHREP